MKEDGPGAALPPRGKEGRGGLGGHGRGPAPPSFGEEGTAGGPHLASQGSTTPGGSVVPSPCDSTKGWSPLRSPKFLELSEEPSSPGPQPQLSEQ